MSQYLNELVAQSAARERETDLQLRLRQRDGGAQRPAPVEQPVPAVEVVRRHPRFDHVLTRLHLAHA